MQEILVPIVVVLTLNGGPLGEADPNAALTDHWERQLGTGQTVVLADGKILVSARQVQGKCLFHVHIVRLDANGNVQFAGRAEKGRILIDLRNQRLHLLLHKCQLHEYSEAGNLVRNIEDLVLPFDLP